MKVSLNWIKEYTKVDLPVDKLVAKIGVQLGAVEEVIDFGAKYKGILVARVVSCEAHPNADKLSLCTIDDGGVVKGVKRDKDGHIQVVCGAPNVRMGMLAAWIPPGIIVPSTLDKEPLKIASRDIRGHISHGMLASAHELGFSDDHNGIIEINEKVKPGTALATVYKLDDFIIDIENKMFTHRPDCFGILGVAREIAGIQHESFSSPDWYLKPSIKYQVASSKELHLEVKNEIPKLVPRFMAVVIKNVRVQPSLFWLQTYLSRVGIKPINNIVDLTNYYMVLTGQPLHAYDYDKVARHTLMVRAPKVGETLTLLGGKKIKLQPSDIVIADKERAIGLGGVMGGADTEVSSSTKNIILECANFDLYSVRKTAMAHGLFTDAVTRFTKKQSPLQNDRVIAKAAQHIEELTGGKLAGRVHDEHHGLKSPEAVKTTTEFINSRLGLALPASEITKLLKNVEFEVNLQGQTLKITPPFWRTDIHIAEDIVEEVGRLYGYDHLPLELPARDISPAKRDELLALKSNLRAVLASSGANELLTYSFVHGNLLKNAGQDSKEAYELANASSPDLQYYRLSLLPSLLEKIHPNVKAGFKEFAVFEIGKAHHKSLVGKDKLPVEEERLALVFATEDKQAKAGYGGVTYYQAAKYLSRLTSALGIRPIFTPFTEKDYKSAVLSAAMAPFDKNRSAYVHSPEGELLGIIGEFKPAVAQALKLPTFSAGFEMNVLQLLKTRSNDSPYVVLPRFPKVEQDITLKVKNSVSYQQLADFVWNQLVKLQPDNVYSTLEPVDIYQKDSAAKHITLRLTIASYDHTLKAQAVNDLLDKVAESAKVKLGAQRV